MENGASTCSDKEIGWENTHAAKILEDWFDQSDKSENENDAIEEDIIDTNTATHYIKVLRQYAVSKVFSPKLLDICGLQQTLEQSNLKQKLRQTLITDCML